MAYSEVRTCSAQQCAARNTGYTYSLSSSYSSAALDYEREHRLNPAVDSPRMARRSLRLHAAGPYTEDGLLDSSFNRSTSSAHWDSMMSVRSRRSHRSASGSGSLLQTPVKGQQTCPALDASAWHSCTASDASLLSTLLDESCIQERTQVDSFWGLDEDGDLKDQTVQADHSLISSDMHAAQTQTSTMHTSYTCSDCTGAHAEQRDTPLASHSSSSKPCFSTVCSYSASAPHTTVYSREKSRRHRPGVLQAMSGAFLYNGRRVFAAVTHGVTLLIQSTVLQTQRQGKALLWSLRDGGLWLCRRAYDLLTRSTGLKGGDVACGGHGSCCGTMNVNKGIIQRSVRNLSGPLCDDCKGKQNVKTCTVPTWSSLAQLLVGTLCFLIACTGGSLLRAGQRLLSDGRFVAQKIPSLVFWSAVSPGRAASGVFWWLSTAWYQFVLLISLLNTFLLTRGVSILRLLLLLLPLLLLLAICWGPSSLWAFLPGADVSGWTMGPHLVSHSGPASVSEEQPSVSPTREYTPDSERLERVEQSLAQLWERMRAADSVQEYRHAQALDLCRALQDQLRERTDRESLGRLVSGLLEQRARLAGSSQHGEESEVREQTQESRLATVEALLRKLELRTEELQRREEAETSTMSRESDGAALQAEVLRLEEALGAVRDDLQGVTACRGRCQQLDSFHGAVSEQVRQEVRALLYGPQGPDPPAPLLHWLSTRFVRSSDLPASLAALQKSILGNLSLQLEQTQQKVSTETVTRAVLQSAGEAGLSEEHVQLMVQNALKLYSQDRTGLADYALESAGGSVLSTRCSETYKTKTALMSLFGLPLWYFSQSPRAVIQPDVHPGNCWAFQGSQGYLVIRLSMKIVPTAFSMEHVPKALSPTGNISSAPRNFTVYGLGDEDQAQGQVLGHYVYQEDGDALQTYPVKVRARHRAGAADSHSCRVNQENNTDAFQIIELRVLSNWGHPEYTCLYRFRVHGEPVAQ
ncbi:SUN domain-containing protein 1 isoform X3 [Brachyhypopomus gauderio]|uniref:SUN domain-containing protein 1 isoform X3 n=1 Tax=Brachyhypopomus gauderio TaxID=698409 RepID=UPI0040426C04